MLFKKKEAIDWSSKPVHNSLTQALDSEDLPPYRILAIIERCGIASGSNYGGLMFTIEGDAHFIRCYPNGGVEDWVGLTKAGDSVFVLVDHEYELGKPNQNKFKATGFINQTLELRFGTLRLQRLSGETREWANVGN